MPRILSNVFKVIYVLSGVLSAIGGGIDSSEILFGASIVGALSWPFIIVSYVLSLHEPWSVGAIGITEDALIVRANKRPPEIIARSRIVGANVIGRQNVHTVEIELRDGDRITLRTNSREVVAAVASELGFGSRRSHARLGSPTSRLRHLPLAIAIHFVVYASLALAFSVIDKLWIGTGLISVVEMIVYLALVRVISAPEVDVGDDGVRVRRGLSTRFFRADDPALIRATSGISVDKVRTAQILEHAKQRAITEPVDARPFDRDGRSTGDWRRHLVASMEGGYRASPLTVTNAAAVLQSAAATASQRVGAGLALRAAGERDKIRVAIDTLADDRVRVALQTMAEEQGDDVVEKAIAKVRD